MVIQYFIFLTHSVSLDSLEVSSGLVEIYTMGTESIQTPLNVSLSVILQPFAKIFFFLNVHTAPHIDRKTQNC